MVLHQMDRPVDAVDAEHRQESEGPKSDAKHLKPPESPDDAASHDRDHAGEYCPLIV